MGLALAFAWLHYRLHSRAAARLRSSSRLKLAAPFFLLAGALVLRPRLHWGDSDWLLVILSEHPATSVDRWLTTPLILDGLYRPVAWLWSPPTFLALFYAALGVVACLMIIDTVKRLICVKAASSSALLFVFSSFGTSVLLLGYFEVYTFVNALIVASLWAAVRFQQLPTPAWALAFGVTISLAALSYMGGVPLLVLSPIPVVYQLVMKANGRQKRLGIAAGFCLGLAIGCYLSAVVLAKETVSSPQAVWRVLWTQNLANLTRVAGDTNPMGWYLPWSELWQASHLLDMVDVWAIYGFFGLLLVSAVFLAAPSRVFRRVPGLLSSDGVFTFLLILAGVYLYFMFTKRFVMGFKDWDLFSYSVYPINLFAVYLALGGASGATIPPRAELWLRHGAATWGLFTFLIMNPLAPRIDFLSPRHRFGVVQNYQLFGEFTMSDHMRAIRDELRALQK